ncbi:MAG: hypothetical protein A3F72_21640 [Bacteroidetes bacterium RIFCSPLOWO2_12_FULL_35_15]|nr:MAG: hypothetical protein A3F72_21640 [Bacteroidetes bacterium RIFCSPLOWO2_12_FULL_35_15]
MENENLDFAARVQNELETFSQAHAEGGIASSIPEIFSYWASHYLSPRLREVFGEHDITSLFANEIVERAKSMKKTGVFKCLSLGSGDCSEDFEIAQKVIEKGVNIKITCTDLNPKLMSYSAEKAKEKGLEKYFIFETLDLNSQFPKSNHDVIYVNHSLHHFVELEKIFTNINSNLNAGGSFIVSDMIGRNGHRRWPEALVWMNSLWSILPLEKKFNNFSKKIDDPYINFDCSAENFEGIRAEDVLPLLVKEFHFEKFVGFGNVIDVFTDRIYGHNYSVNNKWDVAFIDFVENLNTQLIDAGTVKPTAMFGTLVKKTKNNKECVYSRWNPEFSVRQPG